MKKSIVWSKDAVEDFREILEYFIIKSGKNTAYKIYKKIIEKIDMLETSPVYGKVVQDLKDIGIGNIHEITESPWRIIYREQNEVVYILCVLDGRRNVQEILISKVIDQKL